MNPINSSQGGDALGPAQPDNPQVGSPSSPQSTPAPNHQASAANVIRSQIDSLYGERGSLHPAARPTVSPRSSQSSTTPVAPASEQNLSQEQQAPQPDYTTLSAESPYERTHTAHPQPQAEQWKAYHSAWQNYYQKYYEAYYHQKHTEELEIVKQTITAEPQPTDGYFSSQDEQQPAQEPVDLNDPDITKDQALYELRQKLLGKVRTQAHKVRRSKHFVPIAAALTVVLIFVFLQYNRVFIATVNAYISPGSVDPQNIVIDPSATAEVGSDPRLVIPKINVDVPAIYGVGADHDSQMAAMEKGVAHFGIPGANSRPGEVGNTVLSGHSSNDLFDGGDYKFIFAQLEKLKKGDTIYANYEGKRYTYIVTKTEVVLPTEVNKLIYPTDKPMLTLITCTPLGTAEKRLLVTAEQISPDPSQATAAPSGSGEISNESADIPGSSPTLLERLFGAR